MLIKILSWLFEPAKKTRRKSGRSGGDELVGWVLLTLVILAWLG